MKLTRTVKVLGSGCKKCNNVAELIKTTVAEAGKEIELIKVTDLQEMMRYKVMAPPAVVMDEKVVFSGGVPSKEEILSWF